MYAYIKSEEQKNASQSLEGHDGHMIDNRVMLDIAKKMP
jgi:hypothetical protein